MCGAVYTHRARVYRKVEDKRVRLAADGDHENHLTDIVVVRHDHSVGLVLLQLVRGNHSRVGEMLRRADSAYDGVVKPVVPKCAV